MNDVDIFLNIIEFLNSTKANNIDITVRGEIENNK